jgi:CYTH domain-containing protein
MDCAFSEPVREHKYDRVERERRFILDQCPMGAKIVRTRRITDRYIGQTRLRLRHQIDNYGSATFKLTQKIPSPGKAAQQGFLTTIYLNEEEFRILAELPAKELKKTRYSIPPFGIDVFEDSLTGLILAEVEFESVEQAHSLILPPFIVHEVSEDIRFTGGQLVNASRNEVQDWLLEYGVKMNARCLV